MNKDKELILRKIAHSFHKTTGLDSDELYSEAVLMYLEIKRKIPDTSKKRIHPYIYRCIYNHLIDVCKKEKEYKNMFIFGNNSCQIPIPNNENFEILDFSILSQKLIKFIQDDFIVDFSISPRNIRGILFRELRKANWKHQHIWQSFYELKQYCRNVKY